MSYANRVRAAMDQERRDEARQAHEREHGREARVAPAVGALIGALSDIEEVARRAAQSAETSAAKAETARAEAVSAKDEVLSHDAEKESATRRKPVRMTISRESRGSQRGLIRSIETRGPDGAVVRGEVQRDREGLITEVVFDGVSG